MQTFCDKHIGVDRFALTASNGRNDNENLGDQQQPSGPERLHPTIARQAGRGGDGMRR